MKSFTWQTHRDLNPIFSLAGGKLQFSGKSANFGVRIDFKSISTTYLAGCSFGKPPIPVSLWIFNFRVMLDVFPLPYRVNANFLKEYKNITTYWALIMHQALVDTFPIFYSWENQGSGRCHIVTLLTHERRVSNPGLSDYLVGGGFLLVTPGEREKSNKGSRYFGLSSHAVHFVVALDNLSDTVQITWVSRFLGGHTRPFVTWPQQ